MQFVGQLEAKSNMAVGSLATTCCLLAGLAQPTQLEFYEEIQFELQIMCPPLHPQQTLSQCDLKDGDIIIFQIAVPQVGPRALRTFVR